MESKPNGTNDTGPAKSDSLGNVLRRSRGIKKTIKKAAAGLTSVNAALKHRGTKLEVRASIGVALYPADGGSAQALLKSADTAMYRAKRSGMTVAAFGEGTTGKS